jgi:uncharacterized membrane protein (UPF0127 family)
MPRNYFIKKYATTLFVFCFLDLARGYAQKKETEVCFGKKCFEAEIADTFQVQMQGLMFRKDLPDNAGMLFVFTNEDKYGFWMKNTYIPLDIIWMNGNKEIVFIKENAQPCEEENCPIIYPDKEAMYVLELKAGSAGSIGLKIGDRGVFSIK